MVDLGKDDERLLVFTWNVELDDRTQRYGGWVATLRLNLRWATPSPCWSTTATSTPRRQTHAPPRPLAGRLYYSGVLHLRPNTPVYTLLAWDGADA